MEVKIQIPDNCELIKDGDTYIVKEKKNDKPRTWEEFCKNYPLRAGESYINTNAEVMSCVYYNGVRDLNSDKNYCISKQEAEAVLALIQLRQLRKAWVGDWKQPNSRTRIAAIVYNINNKEVAVQPGIYWVNKTLSFPTPEMAKDFLNCFKDLCEAAKILL